MALGLLAYDLTGWIGERAGMGSAFAALGLCAALGVLAAWLLWPANEKIVASISCRPDLMPL